MPQTRAACNKHGDLKQAALRPDGLTSEPQNVDPSLLESFRLSRLPRDSKHSAETRQLDSLTGALHIGLHVHAACRLTIQGCYTGNIGVQETARLRRRPFVAAWVSGPRRASAGRAFLAPSTDPPRQVISCRRRMVWLRSSALGTH